MQVKTVKKKKKASSFCHYTIVKGRRGVKMALLSPCLPLFHSSPAEGAVDLLILQSPLLSFAQTLYSVAQWNTICWCGSNDAMHPCWLKGNLLYASDTCNFKTHTNFYKTLNTHNKMQTYWVHGNGKYKIWNKSITVVFGSTLILIISKDTKQHTILWSGL